MRRRPHTILEAIVRSSKTMTALASARSRAIEGGLLKPAAVVVALACLLLPAAAGAEEGSGYGAGPVFGKMEDGTWSIGWEASWIVGSPLTHASAGGSYQLGPKDGDAHTLHYAVFEPSLLIVGATVGVAVADGDSPVRATLGVWEGFPIPLSDDQPFASGHGEGRPGWMLSFAFGMRWFGGQSQFYFTPKLWRYTPFALGS